MNNIFDGHIKELNKQKVYKAAYLKDLDTREFVAEKVEGMNAAQLKQDIAIQL